MKYLSSRTGPRPLSWRDQRDIRPWYAFVLAFCLVSYGFLPLAAAGQISVSGNIHPNSIEIDNSANHHAGDGNANIKNSGATIDWVKDSLANSDTASLVDSVAFGLITNVTAAAGGTGHWNGVRIVDGFAGGDQDIFLKGGKVNDPGSWVIGGGTVGSSKYDSTQMFVANNQSNIFFGMERRANNGTTAFDFEFTQLPPVSSYIPNRSDGDVLISFELQGSGGSSGSVQTYVFRFNGTTELYQPFCDDDPGTTGTGEGPCAGALVTSINGIEPTQAEPWGYVNSGGNWVLQPGFELRMFAEAQVPLSLLPGVNSCGGSGFVQIRTRASSALGSDAKDTTKIFEYSFGGPNAVATLTGSCDLNIAFNGDASANANGDTSDANGLTYSWKFYRLDGQTWTEVGSSTDKNGTFTPTVAPIAGTYRAILTVDGGGTGGSCTDDATTSTVEVRQPLGATASKTNEFVPASGGADSGFGVSLTGAATNVLAGDTVTYQWQRLSAATFADISGATSTTLSWSLADLIAFGTKDTGTNLLFSGDTYAYNRYSITNRVVVTRTLNGLTCPAESPGVTVRGLKAIDP